MPYIPMKKETSNLLKNSKYRDPFSNWNSMSMTGSDGVRKVWVDEDTLERLDMLKHPEETYDDVILRLMSTSNGMN